MQSTLIIPRRPSNQASITAAWRRLGLYERLLALLLLGYFVGERGFAELHIPGTPLYIGEIILIAGLARILLTPRDDFYFPIPALYCFFGLIALAIFSMCRHVWQDWVSSARDAATAYYMLFAIIACTRDGRWIIIFLSRLFGHLGPLFLAFIAVQACFPPVFDRITPFPDHHFALLKVVGNIWPLHAMIIGFLGCISHDSDEFSLPPVVIILLTAPIALTLLSQSRGATLGGLAALAVFLTIAQNRRMWEWSIAAVLITVLLGILTISLDLTGGDMINTGQVATKFVAIVDPENPNFKQGSADFRLKWWADIIDLNMSRFDLAVFGQGFGANAGSVGGRFDYAPLVRAAHNGWVNVFWWLGLSGLIFYAGFFILVLQRMIVLMRRRNRLAYPEARKWCAPIFAVAIGAAVGASFDNTLSNPVICIPLFTLWGSAIAAARSAAITQPTAPLRRVPRNPICQSLATSN